MKIFVVINIYSLSNNNLKYYIFTGHAPAIPHPFRAFLDRIVSTDEFNASDDKLQFVLSVLDSNGVRDRPTDEEIRQFVYVRNLTSHLVEIVMEDENFKPTKSFKDCEFVSEANLYVLDADKNAGSNFEFVELFEAPSIEDGLNKTDLDPQLIPVPNLLDDYDELERY